MLKLLEPTPRNSLAGVFFSIFTSAFCYPDLTDRRQAAEEQQTAEKMWRSSAETRLDAVSPLCSY